MLRALAAERPGITLEEFLAESGLELDDVYAGGDPGLTYAKRRGCSQLALLMTRKGSAGQWVGCWMLMTPMG